MLNRGTTDTDPILVGTNTYIDGTVQKTRASYWPRANSDVTDLAQIDETSDKFATGIAGAWSSALGYTYVGSMSFGSDPKEFPAQWLPPNNSTIIRNRLSIVRGVWNDVNRNHWPAGTAFYDDGFDGRKAAIVRSGSGDYAELSTGAYDSAAAEGINIDRWVGGRIFNGSNHDANEGIPCVWKYNASTGTYTLQNILSATNWPQDRQGTVMALTDVDANDLSGNGPYAVGYIYFVPTGGEGEEQLGRAFIWSIGANKVKLLNPKLPPPYQVSNKIGGSNLASSFSDTTRTWVWAGDPNSTPDGAIVEFPSFLDPDETANGGKGINDAFFFGGDGFGQGKIGIYDAGSNTGWDFASTAAGNTLVAGSVTLGLFSNLAFADGKNVQITAVIEAFPGARVISIESTAVVSGTLQNLALRYNMAKVTGGLKVKAQFYNWTTQTWTETGPLGEEQFFSPSDDIFEAHFALPYGTLSDYVQSGGSNLVKARLQAYNTPAFSPTRKIAFEHVRLLAKY